MPADVADPYAGLRLIIDGLEAESTGAIGPEDSYWKVPHPVNFIPTFAFELPEVVDTRSYTTVTLNFYPKWKGEYVADAAPIIASADPGDSDAQMKSGVEYDLGNLGEQYKTMGVGGRVAPRFGLRQGFEYKLEVVFEGKPRHTAVIFLQTAE
jgi:hypothetical protein